MPDASRGYEDIAKAIADEHRGFLEPQTVIVVSPIRYIEHTCITCVVLPAAKTHVQLQVYRYTTCGGGERERRRQWETSLVCRSEIYWVGNDPITAYQNGLRHFSAVDESGMNCFADATSRLVILVLFIKTCPDEKSQSPTTIEKKKMIMRGLKRRAIYRGKIREFYFLKFVLK